MAFDGSPGTWDVTLHERSPDGADALVLLPDADGEGIRLDPDDPRPALEEIARRLGPGDDRVGVWAACAGAGATTVAVHLAAAFARLQSCYLTDLDPLRGAARRLGCPPLDPDVRDAALKSRPIAGGFRLIEGELPHPERSEDARVVVDGPREAVWEAGCGTHVIVVPSGRAGVERAHDVLAGADARSQAILVNRTGWGGELTLTGIQRVLGRRVTLELPFSPGLRDAEDRAELMTSPLSPWLNRIHRLARAL